MAAVLMFPEKLEWEKLDYWVGYLKDTDISANIISTNKNMFKWCVWEGPTPIGYGECANLVEAQNKIIVAVSKKRTSEFYALTGHD